MAAAEVAPDGTGGRWGTWSQARFGWCVVLAVLWVAVPGTWRPAEAVEYRLQVANLFEEAFTSFLQRGALRDGVASSGLDRLVRALDAAELPSGALLYDRRVERATQEEVRGFRASPVTTDVQDRGTTASRWNAVTWEGKPGERSIWTVTGTTTRTQEVRHLALKGLGPSRYLIPSRIPTWNGRFRAVALSLSFIRFWGDRDLWDRNLGPAVDLSEAIAVVVGLDPNPLFADRVFIVVRHGEQPITYKAVLGWARRPADFGNIESPGGDQR